MGKKKGLKLGGTSPKLTPLETEILYLLTKDFLTIKQIALQRQTSLNAVYKVRKKLLNYGLINSVNISSSKKLNEVEKKGGHSNQPLKNLIRLHAEQYHLGIIWCDDSYRSSTKKGVVRLLVDGNTILAYRNVIDVYSNTSFTGLTASEAESKSMRYWSRLFVQLESKLKVILVKQGSMNITRVRAEFAETNNELAKVALKEHQKVRVVGDDGYTWLIVDNSFNFNECETVHPKQSKHDMQNTVQPFFNDLRNNQSLLPSQISSYVLDTQKQLNEIAQGLKLLTVSVNGFVSAYSESSQQGTATELLTKGVFYVG